MDRPFACSLSRFGCWVIVVGLLSAAGPVWAFQDPDAPPQPAPDAAPDAVDATSQAADNAQPADPPPPDDPIAPPPSEPEVIKERFPGGELRVLRHAYKDETGKLINHGPWSWWLPNGTKTASGEFVHGKRHGTWTRWFYPGDGPMFDEPMYRAYPPPFVSTADFTHGVLDGKWIITDGRKQTISEWTFVAGVQHGPWIWWDAAGNKLREVHYTHGLLDGNAVTWEPGGKLEEEFIAGRKKYPRTWWFPGPDRRRHVEGWYLGRKELAKTSYDWWAGAGVTVPAGWEGKDQRHGNWTWWYPNGQVETEGAYAFDERVGKWTWYDPEGKVLKSTEFSPPADPAPGAGAATADATSTGADPTAQDAPDAAPGDDPPVVDAAPPDVAPDDETPVDAAPDDATAPALAPEAGNADEAAGDTQAAPLVDE